MAKRKSSDRIGKITTVTDLISHLIEHTAAGKKIKVGMVCENWPEIVGEFIAKKSKAVKIENQILYVETDSDVWRQEMLFRKKEIIRLIQNKYGLEIVKDIIFR